MILTTAEGTRGYAQRKVSLARSSFIWLAHMKVSLDQRRLAHGNVHRGIRSWISRGRAGIVKNGEVVQIAIIPTRRIWERANPWLDFVRLRNINEK